MVDILNPYVFKTLSQFRVHENNLLIHFRLKLKRAQPLSYVVQTLHNFLRDNILKRKKTMSPSTNNSFLLCRLRQIGKL